MSMKKKTQLIAYDAHAMMIKEVLLNLVCL